MSSGHLPLLTNVTLQYSSPPRLNLNPSKLLRLVRHICGERRAILYELGAHAPHRDSIAAIVSVLGSSRGYRFESCSDQKLDFFLRDLCDFDTERFRYAVRSKHVLFASVLVRARILNVCRAKCAISVKRCTPKGLGMLILWVCFTVLDMAEHTEGFRYAVCSSLFNKWNISGMAINGRNHKNIDEIKLI